MNIPDLALDDFESVVFFTGAGLSAESGVPTYRGKGGIWGSYDWQEYACQRAFDNDPDRVWEFHDERRRKLGAADPCRAHRMIAEIQRSKPSTRIVTQNIDGLHQRAGADEVVELHGSIWRLRCDCADSPRPDDEVPLSNRRCTTCGAWLRPDIVWFEDPMQQAPLRSAAIAIQACDLLVSIGTSGVVYPAAELPQLAVQNGATCVEINPEDTPVSQWYPLRIRGGATDALSALWPQVRERISD